MTFIVEGLSIHLDPEALVRRIDQYNTLAEAITTAQETIEEVLRREFQPGMDDKSLFALYQAQGEYPFIFRDDDKTLNVPGFNHTRYAMTRAAEICGGKK
ncbi:MAG: hypothetical protein OER43_10045 [Gammaproteobacteria bacterium]|nr:hypothetical protein [Gammaproteobacteria bacterium]MDH3412495.1 hypothetical protein [Gammaproteobacteria bacterium]